jgi:uncharacterized protein (TIGR02231 family)
MMRHKMRTTIAKGISIMRRILLLTAFFPACAFADQIDATSRITDVTVYPYGAQITRVVTFDAPAGSHDLMIGDLPAETYAEALRIAPGDGVTLGSYALRGELLPPPAPRLTEAAAGAKAEVDRLEAAERVAILGIDAIQTQINAANAQVEFLKGVKVEPTVDATSAAALRDIAKMIGEEVRAAGDSARAAAGEMLVAQAELVELQASLATAREAYATASYDDTLYAGLNVKVMTDTAGEAGVTITQFIQSASWRPVYDLRLERDGDDSLTVQRGVLVSQGTGEDWDDVKLTLSTANPSAQAMPSVLYPEYRSIFDPAKTGDSMGLVSEDEARLRGALTDAPIAAAEPASVDQNYVGQALMQGDVVVYQYGALADVASGVTDLRLALDEVVLVPEITARAVPRADATAFLMAEFTNDGDEVLLPGTAYLYRDGTLIGSTAIAAVQPGQETELAFGAIEGLRLTRDMPVREEGERGLIVSSNSREEVAVLEVENLTDEAWDVRLMDLVPYSEQEDLEITWAADVAVTEEDVDGQRGIMAWDFPLAAGEKKAVTLTTTIAWPDGMVLQ